MPPAAALPIAPPGPVNIHERVLRAMNVPGQNHRDPWFASFFKDVLADSKYVFQTQAGTPFIFTGTGAAHQGGRTQCMRDRRAAPCAPA